MLHFKPNYYPVDWKAQRARACELCARYSSGLKSHFDVRKMHRRARRTGQHLCTDPRRAWRLLRAIVRRGSIEPTILLLIGNLFLSGLTLCAAHWTPVLNYPRAFGVAYLLLAAFGLLGLLGRD